MSLRRLTLLAAALAALAPRVAAYDLEGASWPSGNIPLQLQLGRPGTTLLDGSTSWNDVAATALDTWNPVLQRSAFTAVMDSTAARARGNSFNNVFFDSTIYGQAFGDRVLAVTLLRSSGSRFIESDVVVNSSNTWNSYRGARGSRAAVDLQRVLVHEFGHALGLNHPDQAVPPQSVHAIMNSMITDISTLQDDDIAGANALYSTVNSQLPAPGTLANQTVTAGAPLTLALANPNPGYFLYSWSFARPGESPRTLLDGDGNPWTSPSFSLFSAQPSDAGTYAVAAVASNGITDPVAAQISVTPVSTAGARLVNLSARARAGSGDDTFIAGFVVNGTTPKRVLLHALGPALHGAVTTALADPKLTLFHRGDDGNFSPIADNDNWSADAATASALRTTARRLGASTLADGSKDAALLITLRPGVYSAHVDGQGGTPGIALLEAYDADDSLDQALPRRLVNISARSYIGPGEETLIAGFVIDGTSPKQVLIRVVGPGLAAAGVANRNTDPNLVLFKEGLRIADNDDWAYSNQTDILPDIFRTVGAGLLDADSYDSALLITLPPGIYSAHATGRSGETGVAVMEVYEVP